MVNAKIEIPENLLEEAISSSLFKGELGERIAAQLAEKYAEIKTFNRSDVAQLLNVARSTVYDYENAGLLEFRQDGRISLAALVKFQREFPVADIKEIVRKSKLDRKRKLKI